MRYLKKYENHEDIHAICQKWGIANYTINKDGSIDVDGDVNLFYGGYTSLKLAKLPLNFGDVTGNFYCNSNTLNNLEGCPKSVGRHFYCYHNYLTNLEGCPKSIKHGGLYCSDNNLSSLCGCPKLVGQDFFCRRNRLINLINCPKFVGGDFNCQGNHIETFEGLDFVDIIGIFNCDHNPICAVWILFKDHTKFEFFNDCDIIRENRIIILDRLNFFLDYIGKNTVTEVKGYKCI